MADDTDHVTQSQSTAASIRRQPISSKLSNVLQYAAKSAGVEVDVTSGGQPGKGSGGPRTGSTRHDHGHAADLDLFVKDADGSRRKLDFTRAEDLPTVKKFVTSAAAAGATGIGAGVKYMGPNTLHVDFGREATWGGADWVAGAHAEGRANPVTLAAAAEAPLSGQDMAERIATRATPGEATGEVLSNQVVTNYWPIKGGEDVGVEGSEKTSKPGPTGDYRVSTMEDFRTGKSDYVTMAADPSHYGEWYTVPEYTYKNAAGEQHTLKDVPGYVHDTGSFFKGKPRKFDMAVDYATSDKHGERLDRANTGLNKGTVFVAQTQVAEAPAKVPFFKKPAAEDAGGQGDGGGGNYPDNTAAASGAPAGFPPAPAGGLGAGTLPPVIIYVTVS